MHAAPPRRRRGCAPRPCWQHVRLAPPITAAVVSPLLPDPPVTGGQKRTLRLLEAMERAGLHPHVLTADAGEPGAVERLRARGWDVDVMVEPPPGAAGAAAPARRAAAEPAAAPARRAASPRSPRARRSSSSSTPRARTTRRRAGVPSVLSLHNLDSAVARSAARQRRRGAAPGCASRTARRRCESSSGACSRSPTASCASPRRTPPRSSRAGGRALLAPNGVDDEFFVPPQADSGERALFFGHFGYEANRRGVERFLAEGWPQVRHLRARARGWRSPAAGWTRRCALRLAAVEGVEVLGLVADLPGVLAAARAVVVPIWEGGGTRLKVLEALAAGRAGGRDRRSALAGSASRTAGTGCSASAPTELAAALAGRCSPTRSGRRRWAPTAARSPSATAGRRRSPAPRRCTRRSSRVSAPTADWSSRAERRSQDRGRRTPNTTRQTRREAGTQSHGTLGSAGLPKGASSCADN